MRIYIIQNGPAWESSCLPGLRSFLYGKRVAMENAHSHSEPGTETLSLSFSIHIYIYYIDREREREIERERDRDGEARSADWSMHETVALAAFGDGA